MPSQLKRDKLVDAGEFNHLYYSDFTFALIHNLSYKMADFVRRLFTLPSRITVRPIGQYCRSVGEQVLSVVLPESSLQTLNKV